MKNTNLLFLALLTTTLTACSDTINTSTESYIYDGDSSSNYESSSSSSSANYGGSSHSTSSSSESHDGSDSNQSSTDTNQATSFESFKSAIDNSKPTKVSTIINYNLKSEGITLTYSSTLLIEYGAETKAIYSYSYEKLNPIGSSEFMSTITGICYYTGNQMGIKDGDSIVWTSSVEAPVATLTLNFYKSCFSDYSIDEKRFDGEVKDDKIKVLLDKNYEISNVSMVLVSNPDFVNISRLSLSYLSKEGAEVSINTYYSYAFEKVDF